MYYGLRYPCCHSFEACLFVTHSAGRKALQQKVIDLTILISGMVKSSHGPLGSQVDQRLTHMGDAQINYLNVNNCYIKIIKRLSKQAD